MNFDSVVKAILALIITFITYHGNRDIYMERLATPSLPNGSYYITRITEQQSWVRAVRVGLG